MVIDPVVEAVERGGGFHRLLGVKVVALGEGTASVALPAGERTTNPFGTQSGGALYGLADLAAAGAALDTGGRVSRCHSDGNDGETRALSHPRRLVTASPGAGRAG